MPSVLTLQRLLVFSALVWAVTPRWGGFAFGACWALLAFGTSRRMKAARQHIDASATTVLGTLPPETLAHARAWPLAYVWPSSAESWGLTWQLAGLLCAILSGVFAAWALFTFTAWYLALILPLAIGLVTGGAMARRIKIGERVKEDLTQLRIQHDTLTTLLSLKRTMGQWPPAPSPDPEVKK
ncbi:MAG: hypothetical protein ACOZQL_30905 [Myxococcota bacterium]